jgi:carbonic anhydrase
MSIMEKIRRQQAIAYASQSQIPPEHRPQMLYIGCVDARLDPIDDIGIGKGTALIFRNIGALVLEDAASQHDMPAAPQNVPVGAVLEFFLRHIPAAPGKTKHIVISGHTDCGGLKACRQGITGAEDRYLALYLENLKDVRARVMAQAQANRWDDARLLRALEEESVRQSVHNLRTYPVVQQALRDGALQLHGWIINTATQLLDEMQPGTEEFRPMGLRGNAV